MALAPIPRTQPWIGESNTISRSVDQWLQQLVAAVNASPQQVGAVAVTGAHASIGSTAIPLAPPQTTLPAGTYRATYSAAVTTVGTVSSSLTVTLGWTYGGVAFSQSGAALTGNLTTSQQNGSVLLTIDAATAVTYSTTYASNSAGSMHYALTIALEALP